MAGKRNNLQAGKTKEGAWWSRQRLAPLVKKLACWLWQGLVQHLINLFIIIFIIIFATVVFYDPVLEWVSDLLGDDGKQGGELKRGILEFIGIGIGGLVLWQRARSAEKQAEATKNATENQAKATRSQAKATRSQAKAAKSQAKANKLTEAGHAQECLKTSIEHLGKREESIRIGAAYELYHLAKDRKEYRETVCDILCGHIRQKTQEEDYKKQQKNKPSEEIKTFLKLLKAFLELPRGKEKDPSRKRQVDLSSSFLQGANLSGAHLERANLSGAHLERANLSGAHLEGANLSGARLQGIKLSGSQLQGANLSGAKLQGAWLSEAKLQRADLSEAQLQGAWLSKAQLQGANLRWAQLQGAHLPEAQLQGANLRWAQLQGANLSEAQLQGANLSETQLQEANLSEAQLQGAHLPEAQLQEANLSEAELQGVSSSGEFPVDLQKRIRDRIGKESDFTNAVFSGGLNTGQIEEIIASMPDSMDNKRKEEIKNKLNEHVDKEASNKLPDNSGAITDAYNKDEAGEWIADYEKSTSHQPAKDE